MGGVQLNYMEKGPGPGGPEPEGSIMGGSLSSYPFRVRASAYPSGKWGVQPPPPRGPPPLGATDVNEIIPRNRPADFGRFFFDNYPIDPKFAPQNFFSVSPRQVGWARACGELFRKSPKWGPLGAPNGPKIPYFLPITRPRGKIKVWFLWQK